MVEKRLEIVNQLGLHARAAARLVRTAGEFESEVTIARQGQEADAKSILGVLLLAAGHGSEVTLRCEGSDEEEALAAVEALIADRFGEES